MNRYKKKILKIIRKREIDKKLHPAMWTVPLELRISSYNRIAVSMEKQFVYIRIPKAANSTISKTLALNMFPEKHLIYADDAKGRLSKRSFQRLLKVDLFNPKRIINNFFIFSFFRNPYARLLSCYLDKIVSDCNEKKQQKYMHVADFLKVESTKNISFELFVSYLEKGRNLYKDPHWAPQNKLCPFPIAKLDFFGKVENLNSDLRFVVSQIFGEDGREDILIREQDRNISEGKITKFYNNNIANRVLSLYKKDFEVLGYSEDINDV